ncbi:hypothetical protein HGM15179_019698, partial [Zosterops borbonicus]
RERAHGRTAADSSGRSRPAPESPCPGGAPEPLPGFCSLHPEASRGSREENGGIWGIWGVEAQIRGPAVGPAPGAAPAAAERSPLGRPARSHTAGA